LAFCSLRSLILANSYLPLKTALAFKESPVPVLPAFCDQCGSVYSSGFSFENCHDITMSNVSSGPCPKCSGTLRVPDGVYDITGNVIKIVRGTLKSIDQFKQLAGILSNAQRLNQSKEQVDEAINKEVPELNSLASVLPKTRMELYAFITVILMALTFIIANMESEEEPEIDVEKLIEQSIEKAISAPKKQSSPSSTKKKQGRNEACNCGSGKKYKKCCLQYI
jgi:hypothetical protein